MRNRRIGPVSTVAGLALAIALAGCLLTNEVCGQAASATDIQTPEAPQLTVPPPVQPGPSPREMSIASRVLIVVGPLVAAVALMGLYWLILRRGAM